MRRLMNASAVSPLGRLQAGMAVVLHELLFALPTYHKSVAKLLEVARTSGVFAISKYVVLGLGITAALTDGDLETAGTWLREWQPDLSQLSAGYQGWYKMLTVQMALLTDDV